MKTQSLTRVLGSHASLLGMATYLVLSGPAAAFAATDSKTTTVSVYINSTITLTSTTGAAASMTGSTVPAISAGGAAELGDATFLVNTNTFDGYNVTLSGATCGSITPGILCSGMTGIADTTTAWDPLANANNGNATATPGYGVSFRLLTSTAGYSGTWFGADDTSGAKFAGVPSSAKQILYKGTPGPSDALNLRFRVQAPTGQNSGTYTNTTPITVTATTNS